MNKIFGREPAVWLNAIATVLALASAFWWHFNTDQQGAVNGVLAAVVAVWVGITTHDSWAPLVLGLMKAVLMMALAWHFNISADAQALIFTAASAVLAIFSQSPTQASRVAVHEARPVGVPQRTAPIDTQL